MKTNSIYNERLLKFAKFLEKTTNHPEFGFTNTVNLVELEKRKNISYLITFQEWPFEELPTLFDEWHWSATTGLPYYEGSGEEEGTPASVIDFFDLQRDEFCHLFDIEGLQDIQKFGGVKLNYESDGPDLAKNIYDLVAYRIATKDNH